MRRRRKHFNEGPPKQASSKTTSRKDFFPPPEEWTRNHSFFKFPEQWLDDGSWGQLPHPCKDIAMIYAWHRNGNGDSFPGDKTISAMCGKWPCYVREAKRTLRREWGERFSANGHGGVKILIPKGPGTFLSRQWMDSGLWSELPLVAVALFPVQRAKAWFDAELYCELEQIDDFDRREKEEHKRIYKNRKYDFLKMPRYQQAQLAGINPDSMPSALRALEMIGAIEPWGKGWKVYVLPRWIIYPADYLNRKAKRRYG